MKPGKELDVFVAENVMGLNASSITNDGYSVVVYNGKLLPSYSTDIAAAWEVVEKMRSDYLALRLNRDIGNQNQDDCEWCATFEGNGKETPVDSWSSTAPHAICLAALKACGVQVE